MYVCDRLPDITKTINRYSKINTFFEKGNFQKPSTGIVETSEMFVFGPTVGCETNFSFSKLEVWTTTVPIDPFLIFYQVH